MTVIEVELLSGRYHAHVWGESQFGMGGPEWPPSPWRLLRAIASAWFSAQPGLWSEGERDALLEALGRAGPPEIWLPRASFHELRYYQPVRLGGADRVQHHDHYAVPESGRFWFHFNCDLSSTQRALLGTLLSRLRYFGRSESRARVRLVDLAQPPRGVERAVPRDRVPTGRAVTFRRVLCAAPNFQASDLWAVRDGTREPATDGCPLHLVDTLLKKKMPIPSGAHWVEFALPIDRLVHEIRPLEKPQPQRSEVRVAEIRFRLCRRIPIPHHYLIPLARAFRDAAAARHRRLTGSESQTLTGRDADGNIARGHQHAYYLPSLAEGQASIDKLVVRIPTGCLTLQELDALLGVEHIRIDGSPYPVTVIPEETVARFVQPQAAKVWRSTTPFLPPLRHRKGRDVTCVNQQVTACADRLCGRRPLAVRSQPGCGGLGSVSSLFVHEYFLKGLSNRGRRWTFTRRLGFWLELIFDEPVVLGVPIGRDAHFGAGQFYPLADTV